MSTLAMTGLTFFSSAVDHLSTQQKGPAGESVARFPDAVLYLAGTANRGLQFCVLIAMLLVLSAFAHRHSLTGLAVYCGSNARGKCPVVPGGNPLHHVVLLRAETITAR
jgi:hypothetical protein